MGERAWTSYVAEFIGTFFLVLFICLTACVTTAGIGDGLTAQALLIIAGAHVIALAVGIYAVGAISGAHFNPAVTTALLALRKISPVDAAVYIVMQVLGAIAAAAVVKLLLGDVGDAANLGAPGLSDIVNSTFAGVVAEGLGVFVLVWAVMAMAVNPRAESSFAGLIIGLALGVGVLGMGALTGAALNPARAFGPALISGEFGGAGTWLLVYVVGPIVGGLAAGFLYTHVVLSEQERRWGGRLVDVDVPPAQLADDLLAAQQGPGERPVDKLS
jgi:glycerol uptake facilitator protein